VLLRALANPGVGFVWLTESLGVTTSTGRAMDVLRAVCADFEWEILRERVHTAISHASRQGCPDGRRRRVAVRTTGLFRLKPERVSHGETTPRLAISRTSVRRIVGAGSDHAP
jgi:DNA invertase Pin-like site-specific DNA recombinase